MWEGSVWIGLGVADPLKREGKDMAVEDQSPCSCLSPVGDTLGTADPDCTSCHGTGRVGG